MTLKITAFWSVTPPQYTAACHRSYSLLIIKSVNLGDKFRVRMCRTADVHTNARATGLELKIESAPFSRPNGRMINYDLHVRECEAVECVNLVRNGD